MRFKFPDYDSMSDSIKNWIDSENSVSIKSWKKWNPAWVGRFIAMYWNEEECHVGVIVSGARTKRKIDEDDPNSEAVGDVLIRFCTPVAQRFESQIWFDLDGENAFFIDEFVLLDKFNINVCNHCSFISIEQKPKQIQIL